MTTRLLTPSSEEPSSTTSFATRSDESILLANCVSQEGSFFQKQFIIIEELGVGGFGHVYKVMNKTDEKEYAVKVVKLSPNNGEEALKEARILSGLKHENVIQYYNAWPEKWVHIDPAIVMNGARRDTDENSGTCVPDSTSGNLIPCLLIQMELCTATLRLVIDKKKHKYDQLMNYFLQILHGLEYSHNADVIHRDLNPNNIFIGPGNKVKIGDFGLARYGGEELDAFSPSVGTLLYRAPEVNSGRYNKSADIYSLGIIFFELLYPMASGMERNRVLAELRTKNVIFPGDFFQINCTLHWHKKLLQSILNHDPEKRPSLDNIIAQVFDNAKIQPEFNYKRAVNAILKGNEDTKYRVRFDTLESNKIIRPQWEIIASIETVFKQHGAADFPTPHITPRSSLTDDSSVVNFVTKDGLVVCLPHNSKINFARHIILNSIMNLKRYETLQTFTDTSILHHPKKEYVCVLDIVTCDPDTIKVDAQVLDILIALSKHMHKFHQDTNSRTVIAINHVDVVKSILLTVGVSKEDMSDVLISASTKEYQNGYYKNHVIMAVLTCVNSLEAHKRKNINMTKLQQILNLKGSPIDVERRLLQIVDEACRQPIRMAFQRMNCVLEYLKNTIGTLCLNVEININCFSNVHQYSDILFSLVSNNVSLLKDVVIADGGRYDNILRSLCFELGIRETERFGCGLTVYPSSILQLVETFPPPELVVLTCYKNFELETIIFRLAFSLRKLGYKCDTKFDMTDLEIADCKENPEVLCFIELLPTKEYAVTHKYYRKHGADHHKIDEFNPYPPTFLVTNELLKNFIAYTFPPISRDGVVFAEDVESEIQRPGPSGIAMSLTTYVPEVAMSTLTLNPYASSPESYEQNYTICD